MTGNTSTSTGNIAASLSFMASRQPERIAIHCPVGRDAVGVAIYKTLTYADIDREVGLIASGLIAYGIGPGVRKRVQHEINRRNHEVDIHDLFGVRAKRLNDHGSDRDVGHKMTIHHIDMNPVRTRCIDRAHFVSEARKISRKDRWGNEDGVCHIRSL